MNQDKVASFLVELRRSKKVSQLEVADYIGVSNKTISKWETGSSLPDTFYLPLLSSYYDVTIDEILKGEHDFQSQKYQFKNKPFLISLFLIIMITVSYFYLLLIFIREKSSENLIIITIINVIISSICFIWNIINSIKNKDIMKILYFIFSGLFFIEMLINGFITISLLIN